MDAAIELDSQPLLVTSLAIDPVPSSDFDLPIALWKGKRSCIYIISSFVQYNALSPSSRASVASLDCVVAPKTVVEACSHPSWCAAIEEEMSALDHNHSWDSAPLPPRKKVIGCK